MTEETLAPSPSFYLGFDGGGTKTDCILVDADANVLARATAGPSNPLRAGYAKAWFTLSDAADVVLERHHLKASDIRGICAGIGGAGRESVAKRIATFLERAFPEAAVAVTTDLAITLNAAVGEGEGIILVVGTGSAAYGRDAKGRTARAGGRGPWFSDEGSAFDIGRRAMAAVVRAEENRGPQTALSAQMLKWLGCNEWTRVLDWVLKNPDDVFPRVFPLVGELGDKGDSVACELLNAAAASLGELSASVIEKLALQKSEISIAKAGGTIGRSKFFDAAIDARLHDLAPRARVVALQMKPAEAAAKMAIRLGERKAHAG
ncbi:MAG: BadF/BadG/BcrA/BcrD ATPase family protein [Candidatus Acidiferrales bacterium]|jgi:N-acetylglucosamine kinase-like BadF-type ATPase